MILKKIRFCARDIPPEKFAETLSMNFKGVDECKHYDYLGRSGYCKGSGSELYNVSRV